MRAQTFIACLAVDLSDHPPTDIALVWLYNLRLKIYAFVLY